MTALLLIRRGGDIVGQCDAKCYEAKHDTCTCVCSGANHRAGLERAIINTRAMAEGWVERARSDGHQIDSFELDLSTQHEPLFPLPQETRMDLPTFEEMRRNAHKLLGDAQDELRSDWRSGTGPTRKQAGAIAVALRHIAKAKEALDRAAG